MKVTKRQLRRIIKEEKARLKEQGALPMQGSKEAARGAKNAFNQLINLLVQAQKKAAEMHQLTSLPGGNDAMAHVFGGSEAGEIADELERVWAAAGFTVDGSTLKEFL